MDVFLFLRIIAWGCGTLTTFYCLMALWRVVFNRNTLRMPFNYYFLIALVSWAFLISNA